MNSPDLAGENLALRARNAALTGVCEAARQYRTAIDVVASKLDAEAAAFLEPLRKELERSLEIEMACR